MRVAKFLFRISSMAIIKNFIAFHFLFFKAWGLILTIQIGRAAWEAPWNPGNHLSICLNTQEIPGKAVSRWPVAGPSGCTQTSSQHLKLQTCLFAFSSYLTENTVRLCRLPASEGKLHLWNPLIHCGGKQSVRNVSQGSSVNIVTAR